MENLKHKISNCLNNDSVNEQRRYKSISTCSNRLETGSRLSIDPMNFDNFFTKTKYDYNLIKLNNQIIKLNRLVKAKDKEILFWKNIRTDLSENRPHSIKYFNFLNKSADYSNKNNKTYFNKNNLNYNIDYSGISTLSNSNRKRFNLCPTVVPGYKAKIPTKEGIKNQIISLEVQRLKKEQNRNKN